MSKRCVYQVLSFDREALHNSIKTTPFIVFHKIQSGRKVFGGYFELGILYSVVTKIPA
jgi:hypothetical protein